MPGNETCLEVHDLCFKAREGFAGGLDYGFVARAMELMAIGAGEQLEILLRINRVEDFLRGFRVAGSGDPAYR